MHHSMQDFYNNLARMRWRSETRRDLRWSCRRKHWTSSQCKKHGLKLLDPPSRRWGGFGGGTRA